MSVYDQLSHVPLFACLNDSKRQEVAEFCSVRRYHEGALLLYEEDRAPHLHLLLEGQIRVFKTDRLGNEVFLYMLEPGELVTEFESFDRPTCYANLSFEFPSSVLVLDLARFRAFMRQEPSLMESFMGAFMQKTSKLQCALRREAVFDVTAKVAHYLKHHLNEFNRLKKQAVAERLNIQPETLSRVLRKLIRDKIVVQDGDKIVMSDPEKLESLYR